jgi:phage tail tape-measure protein
MDSDKFDKALTEGALVGLLVGGAAGAGLGAAAGVAGDIVGTGASVGAIAGGGIGAPLGGSYFFYDKDLNQTQRAYYACLETRGYTLTK